MASKNIANGASGIEFQAMVMDSSLETAAGIVVDMNDYWFYSPIEDILVTTSPDNNTYGTEFTVLAGERVPVTPRTRYIKVTTITKLRVWSR